MSRPLARAAAASVAATIAMAIAGVVRVKLYAVFVGASGMGVIGLLQNLLNVVTVLAMLGVGLGIAREVARARGGVAAVADPTAVAATARLLTGGAAVLLVAGTVLAARPLSRLLLDDPGYAPLIALAAPAALFLVGGRNTLQVVTGYGDFGVRSTGTIVAAVLSIGITLPLVWWFAVPGAVGATVLSSAAAWLVLRSLFLRAHPEMGRRGARPDRRAAKLLLALGAVSLTDAALEQLALLAVRSRLIHLHGVEANGLFQGVWGLSQYVLEAAVAFLPAYSFAVVHGTSDRAVIRAETDKAVRMTLLLVAPMSAGVVLLRGFLVRTFLSPEFEPALPLFPYQSAGDLLRAAGLAVGIAILGVAPAWTWLLRGAAASVTFVLAFWILSPHLGIEAAPAGYAISGAVHLLVSWAIMRRWGGLRPSRRVVVLGVTSAGLLGAMIFLTAGREGALLAGSALLLVWAATAVRPSEIRILWDWARRAAGRPPR